MDFIASTYEQLNTLGRYTYGWLLVGVISVLPAIVAGNMLQYYTTRWWRRDLPLRTLIKPLLGNLLAFVLFSTIIALAIFQYTAQR